VSAFCLMSTRWICADIWDSDTFTGVYAAEYLRQRQEGGWDIGRAVRRANKAAALSVMRVGAQEGIPWKDEIERFEAPFR
jgi:ribokinase